MSVTREDVLKVAHLARLTIAEQHIDKYVHNLSSIIDLVEQLNQVDTTDVKPMSHPLDASARLREDVVTETDQRELFQQNAPLTEAGLYLVNQVVE